MKDQNAKPIQFFFADSIGTLWIGASNRLFVLKNGKSISEITSFSKSGAEIVNYITEDRSHDIWVSDEDLRTRSSSLVKIHNEEIVGRYDGTSVLGHQVINALAPTPMPVSGSEQHCMDSSGSTTVVSSEY
jgi:ligand-binding sensor domain-containing protein